MTNFALGGGHFQRGQMGNAKQTTSAVFHYGEGIMDTAGKDFESLTSIYSRLMRG